MEILSQETPKKITVTGGNLENYLGVRKFLPDRLPCTDQVGLVTGLAWTSVGGETLEVEVNVMDGSGKLELTGNLGDVMKESAHAALSYIRANAQKLGVAPTSYKTKDIHVHFPEGAVPKRRTLGGRYRLHGHCLHLTGVSVRRDIAMTGEISFGDGSCASAVCGRRPWRHFATACAPSSFPRTTSGIWRKLTRPSGVS